ncbi:DUF354 domain-containing protein [Haloarculaceae archaeon H-GB2-1]|nr:DUF354 domain-containing protein [Haloarculaceae archaeon H-GB2-1]
MTIQHPGHVHFFRPIVAELTASEHDVRVFCRENASAVALLDRYDMPYEKLADSSESVGSLARTQLTYEARLFRRARRFDPDVMTAIGGVAVSHVAKLVDAESVVFYDTEHASLIRHLAFPFADTVCTPDSFDASVLGTHRRYPGYHELAYLHPERFTPDDSVLEAVGASRDDRIAVVRLGDWSASHDVGESGFGDPHEVIERLEATGAEVLLTAEGAVPPALADREFDLPPERFHDLLALADCYVGEGATTAAEAAVLGTPAVYVNSLSLGYLDELASYDLVVSCNGPNRQRRAIRSGVEILEAGEDVDWDRRRARVLERTVDVTDFAVAQITRAGG